MKKYIFKTNKQAGPIEREGIAWKVPVPRETKVLGATQMARDRVKGQNRRLNS